ncbi:MAG: 2'-5' RNA ligase family protein [Bacteriovoracaceae bacterium]
MKKYLAIIVLSFSFFGWAQKAPPSMIVESYSINKAIFETKKIPMKSHNGKKEFERYLSMELPYAPVKALYQDLQKRLGKKLITRKEAHITVITPVEFDEALSSKLTMSKIEEIAKKYDIQNSPFTIKCLGRAEVKGNETYYLVVESEALTKIRSEIAREFVMNHGVMGVFKPVKYFFPHITVGFTKRDLHLADGVVKDEKTCTAPVIIE